MKKYLTLVFVLIVIISQINKAQWGFSFSVENEYNSNPFISPQPFNSLISTLNFGLQNELSSFSAGYYGNYVNINSASERNFYWHQFALWKDFESSSLGIYAEQRINKTDFEYYNYTNYTAYYRTLLNLGDFFVSFTPNVSITKYSSIPILDNFKASLGSFINRSFETGTTFILGGSLNFKKYLSPTQTETVFYINEENRLVRETFIDNNISSITQLVSYLRTAQSITPTTGLAIQFTNRIIFNKVDNSLKDLNMIYGDESEIFDDPLNYEGNSIAFELTQILFDDLYLRGGYYINKKYYPSQGTYDQLFNYDTELMRSDTQRIFALSFKKNFTIESFGDIVFYSILNFNFVKNESNSYWFNYNGNSINLDFGIEF